MERVGQDIFIINFGQTQVTNCNNVEPLTSTTEDLVN